MVDLHSHSTASDGLASPADSARHAIEKKLKAWALTDHDTVDGLFEAAKTCAESDTIFVPGIEITVRWPVGEFHLLGLGLKKYSDELKETVQELTEDRRSRNLEIVEKMNRDGVEVTLEEIEAMFSESQIGRPHFAQYLKSIGMVKNVQEAFQRFLGNGKKWYATHNGCDLDFAVNAIKSAGGIPVLAHPLSLYVPWKDMEETVSKLQNHGIEGLEAYHPGARPSEAQKLAVLAKRLGMFVTGGSDFHGKGARADRHLGVTTGDKKIDDRFFFEELLPRLGDFNYKETDWYTTHLS